MLTKFMHSSFARAFTIAITVAILFVLPVLAQGGDATPPTDLHKVLQDFATGGAAVFAAILVSWLAANIPAFNALSFLAKFGLQVGASAALGLGSWYLITYAPGLVDQLAPIFSVLVLSLFPIVVNQVWHATVNKSS